MSIFRKLKTVDPALLIFGFTTFAYLLSFLYEEGFYSFFNVPETFIQIDTTSIFFSLLSIFLGLLVLFSPFLLSYIIILKRPKLIIKLPKLIRFTLLLIAFDLVYIGIISPFSLEVNLVLFILFLLTGYLELFLITPFIRRGKITEDKSIDRIYYFFLVLIVVFAALAANLLGTKKAASQRVFACWNTECDALIIRASGSRLVVVKINKDTNELKNELVISPNSDTIKLQIKKVGKLKNPCLNKSSKNIFRRCKSL